MLKMSELFSLKANVKGKYDQASNFSVGYILYTFGFALNLTPLTKKTYKNA